MNVLEKILEEIEKEQNSYEADHAWNYSKGMEYAKEIIRSHMNEVENDGWISVEERLPKRFTVVLASFDNGDVETLWQCWREDEEELKYFELGDEERDGGIKKVIAWRPLPKPYKPKKTIPVAGMDHIMSRFTKVE